MRTSSVIVDAVDVNRVRLAILKSLRRGDMKAVIAAHAQGGVHIRTKNIRGRRGYEGTRTSRAVFIDVDLDGLTGNVPIHRPAGDSVAARHI